MLVPQLSSAIVANTIMGHIVTCGIASVNGNDIAIVKATDTIPFVTAKDDPDYYFGCTINNKDTQHELKASLITPLLTEITSNVSKSTSSMGTTTTTAFGPYSIRSFGFLVFQFDESDPLGVYKLVINIDNKFVKIIKFYVVKVGN